MDISYEETRRRRVEENNKRMEALHIKKLSMDLKNNPKISPAKPSKPRVIRSIMDVYPVRRSIRMKGTPNYKEDVVELPLRRVIARNYQRRDLSNRIYAGANERAFATERAEELQSGLKPEFPSFVKPMLQSHVTGGFWLGLPNRFCKSHLPKHDEEFILEDEDEVESSSKYLGRKCGLSAGWRGFAIEHQLVDGDALVFQLVEPTRFKVYIIRVYKSDDSDDDSDNVKRAKADTDGPDNVKQMKTDEY